jgi:hypothetical protein
VSRSLVREEELHQLGTLGVLENYLFKVKLTSGNKEVNYSRIGRERGAGDRVRERGGAGTVCV